MSRPLHHAVLLSLLAQLRALRADVHAAAEQAAQLQHRADALEALVAAAAEQAGTTIDALLAERTTTTPEAGTGAGAEAT